MTKKIPIIAFAPHPWDEPQWMNRQHLLSRLGERGWPIVYNTGALSLWQRNTEKWKTAPYLSQYQQQDNVSVHIAGKAFPTWPKSELISNFSRQTYTKSIKKYLDVSANSSITLLFHPEFYPYANYLKSKFLALHVYDSYSGMPNWDQSMEIMLSNTVKRADLITASTASMAESLPLNGVGKTKILHNGVDPTPFLLANRMPCPEDLKDIPHPRIANLGTVNLKMDMKLIAELANKNPNWSWVFVGRLEEAELNTDNEARDGLAKCKKLSNVYFLGEKSRHAIPAYAQHINISTICYRIRPDDWVIAGYPLKLNEYLAVGKPVVASPQTAICEYFSDVVAIAKNESEWQLALEHALNTGGVGTPDQRIATALSNSWEKRVDAYEEWLLEMIS
ncbi:glycosyltransferase [Neptunomonas antarctica]|uniref:Glycosyltransferase involved in cell wall bisynthesis n=1 Tax=Neptunomonas antarctica TaxID=619304 RepID=A0A1N7JEF6_9GAMM|nr:glycosyltransferase [Neptunomonas antarctica]SIS47735.1 Glycosyltransferase involved in cell wall bisynthesis [Neptunomonas antarctica]